VLVDHRRVDAGNTHRFVRTQVVASARPPPRATWRPRLTAALIWNEYPEPIRFRRQKAVAEEHHVDRFVADYRRAVGSSKLGVVQTARFRRAR
jgi:hypothetical protein